MSIVYDVVSVTMRLDRDWSVHLFEVIVGPESSEKGCSISSRMNVRISTVKTPKCRERVKLVC